MAKYKYILESEAPVGTKTTVCGKQFLKIQTKDSYFNWIHLDKSTIGHKCRMNERLYFVNNESLLRQSHVDRYDGVIPCYNTIMPENGQGIFRVENF